MTIVIFLAGLVVLVAFVRAVMWLERICNPPATSGGAGDEGDDFDYQAERGGW